MMKKFIWAFPVISGIVAIVGVVTPVASYYNYFSIWIWGLLYSRMPGISLEFIDQKIILIIGISTSIVISVCSLSLIITGYLYKQGNFDDKKVAKLWIYCGVFIMISIITTLISLDFYTYNGNFPYGVWDFLNPGFGAIGTISGSIIAMGIGVTVSVSGIERIRKIIPIPILAPTMICPFCERPLSLNASFCNKCGNKIYKNVV